jgi:hypothetical protein
MPTDKEGLFTQVRRESQERRAQADRRSAERRAVEQAEIAKQIAARKPQQTVVSSEVSARDEDEDQEGLNDPSIDKPA